MVKLFPFPNLMQKLHHHFTYNKHHHHHFLTLLRNTSPRQLLPFPAPHLHTPLQRRFLAWARLQMGNGKVINGGRMRNQPLHTLQHPHRKPPWGPRFLDWEHQLHHHTSLRVLLKWIQLCTAPPRHRFTRNQLTRSPEPCKWTLLQHLPPP